MHSTTDQILGHLAHSYAQPLDNDALVYHGVGDASWTTLRVATEREVCD